MGGKKTTGAQSASLDDPGDPNARKRARQDDGTISRLLESNQFASLKRADEANGLQRQQQQQQRKTKPSLSEQPTIPKKEVVPPLFTSSKEAEMMRKDLAYNQIHPLFKLCHTGTKIVCSTFADYEVVRKYLGAKKLEYYTHDVPGTKPLKVVIHGLGKHTPEELMEELKAVKLKPVQVFPINRSEGKTYRDSLYLVHLEKGSVSMAELSKKKALFQTIIEWQRYRPKKKDVTQCSNCLAYGHGTRNCHMLSRCGKCAGQHTTADCQQMEEDVDPKCANCGANHEGYNRACPKRAEFLEIRKRASGQNQRQQRQRQPPPRTDEHFPALRYQVPNLPPLQPHRQKPQKPATASERPSVQDRLATAAATPPVAPAWANFEHRRPPINDPLDDGTLFPTKMMSDFAVTLFGRLLSCRSKREQISAVCDTVQSFMDKYGP